MDEEKKVANEQVKETPPVESTPQETTEKTTTDGAVAKQEPVESSDRLDDRFDKHPRFQELNKRAIEAEAEVRDFKSREAEEKFNEIQQRQSQTQSKEAIAQDPYAGLSAEDKHQTDNFIDKFVMPKVERKYGPSIRQFQERITNEQVMEVKDECARYGIDFTQKLPEIIKEFERPENQLLDQNTGQRIGPRLTIKEATRNLYFEEAIKNAQNKTVEQISKEREVLMEKKKQANMPSSTVSPNAVIQSNEMARQKMSEREKQDADIRDAIELANQGVRNPKVKTD